jgi:predicted amidohydrolase YtcJ
VGEAAEILALRGRRTEVVDLGGRTVTPGLIDAPTHPVLGRDSVDGVDVSSCADLAALHAKVAEAAPTGASGAERWAGRIAVGCITDLTVFAADPLRVPAWDLPSVPVDMTVVDGRVRHRNE